MEGSSSSNTGASRLCTCNICSLHPHLKEALRRMQPPELRLYSRGELLELLEKDISNISDEEQKQLAFVQRELRKEFIGALAAYLASRITSFQRDARRAASNFRCLGAAKTPTAGSSNYSSGCSSSSCCSFWESNKPITLLECGAGTGILAVHLLPLLQQQLQAQRHPQPWPERDNSTTVVLKQQQRRACSAEPTGREQPLVPQEYKAVCSEMHNDGSSSYVSTLSDGHNSPGADSTALPVFSYVASEPRSALQWCPTGLAATREGCRSAMERHFPQVVICCWMPFNVDWTEKARASCCACCRRIQWERSHSAALQEHHRSLCRVQEYILIGHAEGGLVGRPFETWGMRRSEADMLPLGVDYEVPQALRQKQQRRPPCSSSEGESDDPGVDEQAVEETKSEKEVGRKRPRGSTNEGHGGGNGRQWKPANHFQSIPPEVPAREVDNHTERTGDAEMSGSAFSRQQQLEDESGGQGIKQQLLPLQGRPYYREGFIRLPPLPTEKDAETFMGEETTESSLLLKELQQALPLSRFDSLHSLRAKLPPVSQIVVFRRMRNTPNV